MRITSVLGYVCQVLVRVLLHPSITDLFDFSGQLNPTRPQQVSPYTRFLLPYPSTISG